MRKLATIRTIDEIRPIEGADAIECAVVGGWTVVVKKGEYKPGGLAVYCEIDSWIPHELAPFLSKGQDPREYNGVKGERLRTVKLRGTLSQGLLLPIPTGDHFDNGRLAFEVAAGNVKGGDDVTEILGIQKWEAPIPAQLAGQVRGNFPTEVPKTDQERVQNLKKEIAQYVQDGDVWEITEKLDGSSCTYYLDLENEFHVCSRNLDLKFDENNSFWKVAVSNDVSTRMRGLDLHGFALQGELVGEGIQKNRYGLKGQQFFLFDVYDVKQGCFLPPMERRSLSEELNINHVPVTVEEFVLEQTVDELLQMAEARSELANTEREGIVFKHSGGQLSFKAISNKFLLKGGE